MRTLQIKRGSKANLPTLAQGEFGFVTDYNELYIGNTSGNIQIATTASVIKLDGTSTTTAVIPFAQGIQTNSISGNGSAITISDDIDLSGHKIINVATPTGDADPVNKAYVDQNFIKIDGTTATTAVIPFASGIKSDTIVENTVGTGISLGSNTTVTGTLTASNGIYLNSSSANVITAQTGNLSVGAVGNTTIYTSNADGSELLLSSRSVKATNSSDDTPFLATEDDDVVTKKYLDNTIGTNSSFIRTDGTSTTTAEIPFDAGIHTDYIRNQYDSVNIRSASGFAVYNEAGDTLQLDFNSTTNTLRLNTTKTPTDANEYVQKHYVDSVASTAIKADGTTTTTAVIPFANGIKTTSITSDTTVTITNVANPVNDNDAATKSYVDSALADIGSGAVVIESVTIPATGWVAHGDSGIAWSQTITNASIPANANVLLDAGVDELVAHYDEVPVTSLTTAKSTDGSVIVYAVSDTIPTSDYIVNLICLA